MRNRKFSNQDIILILSLVVVILGILYYSLFWTNYKRQLRIYNDINLQSELEVEQMKADSLSNMKNELDHVDANEGGVVAYYNNQSEEISILNEILTNRVDDLSMNWEEADIEDSIARRQLNLSFKVDSYSNAVEIINSISNCGLRNIINHISVEGEDQITVTMVITFFERV